MEGADEVAFSYETTSPDSGEVARQVASVPEIQLLEGSHWTKSKGLVIR